LDADSLVVVHAILLSLLLVPDAQEDLVPLWVIADAIPIMVDDVQHDQVGLLLVAFSMLWGKA
jgi:hypothetical protein